MAADKGSFSGTSLAAGSIPAEWELCERQSGSILAWATQKTKLQPFLCFLVIPPFSS